MGWFKDNGNELHGWGKFSESKQVGIFENNSFRENNELKGYSILKDIYC